MAGEQFLYHRPTFPAQLDMSHPLTKGLVGCWVLNEEGGMRALDSSPYQNHGTVTGAKGNYQGRTFIIANSDKIVMPDIAGLKYNGTQNITVLGWFKTGSDITTVQAVASKWDYAGTGANYREWIVYIDSGNLAAEVNGTAGGILTTAISTYTLYNFALTANSSKVFTLFLAGVQKAQATNSQASITLQANNNVALSVQNGVSPLGGTIGGVLGYNKSLIAADIQQLYLNPYEMFMR